MKIRPKQPIQQDIPKSRIVIADNIKKNTTRYMFINGVMTKVDNYQDKNII